MYQAGDLSSSAACFEWLHKQNTQQGHGVYNTNTTTQSHVPSMFISLTFLTTLPKV